MDLGEGEKVCPLFHKIGEGEGTKTVQPFSQ
jgi:hypothetical protein